MIEGDSTRLWNLKLLWNNTYNCYRMYWEPLSFLCPLTHTWYICTYSYDIYYIMVVHMYVCACMHNFVCVSLCCVSSFHMHFLIVNKHITLHADSIICLHYTTKACPAFSTRLTGCKILMNKRLLLFIQMTFVSSSLL